jgi:hypothetical protein
MNDRKITIVAVDITKPVEPAAFVEAINRLGLFISAA